jgi:STAS domain
MTLWCRARAGDDGQPPTGASVVIEGTRLPDLAAVDELARWALEAKRAGRRLVIEYLAPQMADLLDLAGLDLVGLGVEMQGQAEGGEEPLGIERVEEEGQLGDLPA